MQGVPTTVSVSGIFLKKCMNDPQKAKYLEENLAALPDCASYAVSHSQGTLTSICYQIDANGNITAISSGTNDPDGTIARENAQRRAKEKKAAEEKAARRREEKKAEEEKTVRLREERKKPAAGREPETFTLSATGTGVKSVTQMMMKAISDESLPTGGNFDRKA